MDIYTETILDHYQNPHHLGTLTSPTFSIVENNPICGDTLKLELKIKNNMVKKVAFTGNGCAISQASMSMLTDYIENKKVSTVKKIKPKDIYNLLGITISPGRVNCALLGWRALQKALEK